MNAVEIEAVVSDLAVQPFDASEFGYAFLAAFGNKNTTLKKLRSGTSNSSDISRGVLQRNHIHLAGCDVGQVTEQDQTDLYNMHDNPRPTREQNDKTLEPIYIVRRFKSDTERLEKLFDLYVKMTATAPAQASKAQAKRVKRT